MKLSALTGNLGLKILSLALAIVLYYALKPDDASRSSDKHDTGIFQYR